MKVRTTTSPVPSLESARKAAGISIEGLAVLTCSSAATIRRWERNQSAPTRPALDVIRKKLPAAFEPKKEEVPHVHDPPSAPGPAG